MASLSDEFEPEGHAKREVFHQSGETRLSFWGVGCCTGSEVLRATEAVGLGLGLGLEGFRFRL